MSDGIPDTEGETLVDHFHRVPLPRHTAAPRVRLGVSVEPSVYSLSNLDPPALQYTLTSCAPFPITICTEDSFLEARGSFIRLAVMGNDMKYVITDLGTGQRVWQTSETRCGHRPPAQCFGPHSEQHYHTLPAHGTLELDVRISPATSWNRRKPEDTLNYVPRRGIKKDVEFRQFMEPGHTYSIALKRRQGIWWKYGTKEEVLAPAGTYKAQERSEPRLRFEKFSPVVLTMEE